MNTTGQFFGGDWTEQKLDCVQKYLHAYTTIMNKQPFKFAYIDAFAGTGYRELILDEDENETLFPELDSQEVVNFRQGSARNALEVKPPFKKYIFIEEDKKNYTELKKLRDEFVQKEAFSEDSIECIRTDANQYLTKVCNKNMNWKNNRALVFLDPFGMQVEWKTIELIADTEAIDLWLLFPIGTVNRLLKRNGEIRQPMRKKLNLFFGDDGWFEVFYKLAHQNSLFGEEGQWEKTGNIFTEIERYFMKRLDVIFADVATNPLSLRNSKNVPLYLLCFAAGNPRGAPTAVKIAQDILLNQLHKDYNTK